VRTSPCRACTRPTAACARPLILLGGDLVDPVDLRLRLDLITTTSPSALLYGSIDGFRRRMVSEGRQLLEDALHRVNDLRERLGKVHGFTVLDESIIGHDGVAEWDPLKLSVDVSELGITGYDAKDWLQSERRLTVQLGDARRVVCSMTYSDDDAAFERLGAALEALAADPIERPTRTGHPAARGTQPRTGDVPAGLSSKTAGRVIRRDRAGAGPAAGVSAEMISPYPPGVPAILPGQRFNSPVVDYLWAGLAAGMTLPDAADPQLKTFRVVRATPPS
jgi:arginine decarboxylase